MFYSIIRHNNNNQFGPSLYFDIPKEKQMSFLNDFSKKKYFYALY